MAGEGIITGGLGLLPLAVLGRPPRRLTSKEWAVHALERVADRVVREAPKGRASQLVLAAMILSGMYLGRDEIRGVIRRFPAMIQSSAYEVFEELGAILNARKIILRQGEVKFGKPTDEQRRRLEVIEDLPRLERLSLRLLKVDDWDALLKGR